MTKAADECGRSALQPVHTTATSAARIPMELHQIKMGAGKPLLLLHGLGGSWRSWTPILPGLAAQREVIAVDLPGHGATPQPSGELSFEALADAVAAFLESRGLQGIDVVGSSMGARLVLELARRGGLVGSVVSLDPGGFWKGWERTYFATTIGVSIRLVRALQPVMPLMTGNPLTRALLLAQFSAHPWRLPSGIVLQEMRDYAAAPSFDALLRSLARGPAQQGVPAGTLRQRILIVWGRQDRVCLPRQAARAMGCFPDARLQWLNDCGHFPHWDQPEETVRLVLEATH